LKPQVVWAVVIETRSPGPLQRPRQPRVALMTKLPIEGWLVGPPEERGAEIVNLVTVYGTRVGPASRRSRHAVKYERRNDQARGTTVLLSARRAVRELAGARVGASIIGPGFVARDGMYARCGSSV
jgi:hypothetical protein